MSPPPPPYTDGFFASDEFHPSATGYRDWVEFALEDSGLIVPNEPGTLNAAAIAEASGPASSESVSSESASSGSASSESVDDAGAPSADAAARP
jgi:hypothetical protein